MVDFNLPSSILHPVGSDPVGTAPRLISIDKLDSMGYHTELFARC